MNWKKNLNYNLNRRNFLQWLGATLFLKPLSALADWNNDAFWAGKQPEALENMFPEQAISESSEITIGVNSFIENGAVVPIKINTTLPDVSSISIFVENNPNPLIAHFELQPRCLPFAATRIKVDRPSNITAVVQSMGKLYQTTTYIEVAEGGCS